MSEHLSRTEAAKFMARDLAPAELLRLDEHVTECAHCREMIIERTPNINVVREMLAIEENDPHLSFDTVCSLVDGGLDAVENEIAEVHASECRECTAAIADLREIRDHLAEKAPVTARPYAQHAAGTVSLFRWWKFALPVAALIVAGVFVWAFILQRPRHDELASVTITDAVNAPTATMPDTNENSDLADVNVDRSIGTSTIVSINDAGGKVEVDREGRITGISAKQFERMLGAALTSQSVNIPDDVRNLRTSSGTLMGATSPGVPFRLVGPIGRVVESSRPSFKWKALEGAESYRIGLYEEDFRPVVESAPITGTSWTPGAALPRGKVYQWQVTALVDGKEVVSPTRPAAEAKFKVLGAAEAAEIQKARRTAGNSNLLMGIVYANAGMLAEAEREFQALLRNNPNSEIARKLLAKVRNAR